MHTHGRDLPCASTIPGSSSSRLRPQQTAAERTTLEQQVLDEALERCERRFDHAVFFGRLAGGTLTPAALRYVFGQYGHFRLQLHRWFAACIVLAGDASQPAQRQAILALSDHIFTDLRDGHDLLFAELLHGLGHPAGTLRVGAASPTTTEYIESFLHDCRTPTATWFEAIAALCGRELSVALRNQRLLKGYFDPRGLPRPTWIALHAELEIEHFLDAVRPLLTDQSADATSAVLSSIDRGVTCHATFLDALLHEHEEGTTGCGVGKTDGSW